MCGSRGGSTTASSANATTARTKRSSPPPTTSATRQQSHSGTERTNGARATRPKRSRLRSRHSEPQGGAGALAGQMVLPRHPARANQTVLPRHLGLQVLPRHLFFYDLGVNHRLVEFLIGISRPRHLREHQFYLPTVLMLHTRCMDA